MKESEMETKIVHILNDFENLETMPASEAWNQLLMDKLVESKSSSVIAAVLPLTTTILLMLVLNVVCVMQICKHTQYRTPPRIAKLNVIATELLMLK